MSERGIIENEDSSEEVNSRISCTNDDDIDRWRYGGMS